METQPENHNRRVTDQELHEFVVKWKELVELEKKQKEAKAEQTAENNSYKVSFTTRSA